MVPMTGTSRDRSARSAHKKDSARSSHKKGVAAEELAAVTLERNGYMILDRRYRTPAGEVDLVAISGDHLAFVEVKRRASHADAAWAITTRQQQRIANAAELWLQAHPDYQNHDITFDAVLISPQSRPKHMQDAFRI